MRGRSTAGGKKLANGEGLRSSERNGKVRKRRLRGLLMKKGCKEGGVSL